MDDDQTDESIKRLCQLATQNQFEAHASDSPVLERVPTADQLQIDAEGYVFVVQTPQRYTPKSQSDKRIELSLNKNKQFKKERQLSNNSQAVVSVTGGKIMNKKHPLAVKTVTEDIHSHLTARISGNIARIPQQVSFTDDTSRETGDLMAERRRRYVIKRQQGNVCRDILKRMDSSTALKRLKQLKLGRKESCKIDAAVDGGNIDSDDASSRRSGTVQPSECGEPGRAAERWRWVTCMVFMLNRLLRTMGEVSVRRTQRSAVEWQWHSLYTVSETTHLALNPLLYARGRTRCSVPRWAKEILAKLPDSRTSDECQRLHALLRGHKSFDKFTQQIQLAMCRAFTLQFTHSQRIILREGHVGQNFYFIFSGSVFINIDDVSDGQRVARTEAVLSKGDAFGEVALLRDIRRTATVTCREACELLIVDKDVFALVCPRIFDKEFEERVNFISSLTLFAARCWTSDTRRALCHDAQVQEYMLNKVIVEESALDDWLYIVMQGECRVIARLTVNDVMPDEEPPPEIERPPCDFQDEEEQESADQSPQTEKEEIENRKVQKKLMLESMKLGYVNDAEGIEILEISQSKHEDCASAFLQSSKGHALTFNQLMQRRRAPDDKADYVYMVIGQLSSTQEFNLIGILQSSEEMKQLSSRSSLILVSNGARMLRIRRDLYMKSLDKEGLAHAKWLAYKNPYPSNAALAECYQQMYRWRRYKKQSVRQIVLQTKLQRLQKPQALPSVKTKTTKRHTRQNRLVQMLERSGSELPVMSPPLELQTGSPLALDDPGETEGPQFESRMLRESLIDVSLHPPYVLAPGPGRCVSRSLHRMRSANLPTISNRSTPAPRRCSTAVTIYTSAGRRKQEPFT